MSSFLRWTKISAALCCLAGLLYFWGSPYFATFGLLIFGVLGIPEFLLMYRSLRTRSAKPGPCLFLTANRVFACFGLFYTLLLTVTLFAPSPAGAYSFSAWILLVELPLFVRRGMLTLKRKNA